MRDPFWHLFMGSDITDRNCQSVLEEISFARELMKWDLLYCGYDEVPRITREEFDRSIEKSVDELDDGLKSFMRSCAFIFDIIGEHHSPKSEHFNPIIADTASQARS